MTKKKVAKKKVAKKSTPAPAKKKAPAVVSAGFGGFGPGLIQFFGELSLHNDREWFEANRQRYEREVREPALGFIRAMQPKLAKISSHFTAIDKKVGGSLMRIHRDVRFSSNKDPYKTNLGIQFRHEVGKDVHAPGLYVHVDIEGVFLGAVWADSAWGRYWGWDPKEVWALIIWLVYLGYIHFRMMGWVGYRPALINLLGFSAVLMTFWGVNILANVFGLNSIHAYSNGGQEDIYFLAILAVGGLAPIVMLFLPGPKRDLKDIEDEEDEIVPSIRRHVGGGAPGSSDGLHPTPPGRSPQPPAEHKQS